MRRLMVIALVAVIGMVVLAAPPVTAQEGDPTWEIGADDQRWEGVGRPEPPSREALPPPPAGDLIMEPYAVFFSEDYAAVPEMREFVPEFMVVVVQKGNFALDTGAQEPGIVIFPAKDQPVPIMQPKQDDPPYYVLANPAEYIQDPSGGNCTLSCPVPPDAVVQLKPGDRIVAREGALCVWCLLNSNFDPANPETETDDQGLLEVFALLTAGASPESFSWIRDWESNQPAGATSQDATPELNGDVTAEQMTEAPAWAFFNPAANCRSP